MHHLTRLIVVFLIGVCPLGSSNALAADRPNVLFIAIDDLRPELNCYGRTHIHSPNIDRLASQGTLFERAYCMVPTCGASRAALMTGIRPANNRFKSYLTRADEDVPGITTLNTHFKNSGHTTVSLGKIFHHKQDNASGWSETPWGPGGGLATQYQVPENLEMHRELQRKEARPNRGPAFEAGDVPDEAYPDGQIAERAVSKLQTLSESDEPFFLAVGFLKPHLPFNCPKKYWDLYDAEEIEVPENYHPPTNAPDGAVHTSGELRAYGGIPNEGVLEPSLAKHLIHGYYACVSYTDAQIGKVLNELDRLRLTDDTIVVLWGDHGWNLGEHTMWCKHSCFETSLHSPLIFSAPGFEGEQRTAALTEFIDVYPTLCELTGIPLPLHLEGRSVVPLMKDPNADWKTAAISRYKNGDSLRTDQFRFTQYWERDGSLKGRMLYNHSTDPGENSNVAGAPANLEVVQELLERLHREMGKPNL